MPVATVIPTRSTAECVCGIVYHAPAIERFLSSFQSLYCLITVVAARGWFARP